MTARPLWLLPLLAALAGRAEAAEQPLGMPPAPQASLAQRLDAQLPLDMVLTDENGRPVRLGRYFDAGRPVLLVPGYYRCPQLCSLLMHGLLESLQRSGLDRRDFRIVRVSIDPDDTPAVAHARREADLMYADVLLGTRMPGAPLDLHLLVGSGQDTSRLARQVGFRYEPTPPGSADGGDAPARFAHPASAIVVTPGGRVSRYLMGVSFDPAELRQALVEASDGGIGTLNDRIALLCAHVDWRLGRHTPAVMALTRAVGVLLVAAFAAWCLRRRDPRHGSEPR